jgi:hypothetical protein
MISLSNSGKSILPIELAFPIVSAGVRSSGFAQMVAEETPSTALLSPY